MAHLLAERYELTALIGSGPTGEVWRARERGTREWLAVKLLDPHLSADPHTVDRFQRERHVLTAFLHLAYVRVRDLVAEGRTVALVMELVNGVDLRTRLDRGGPLPPAEAAEVAATVAEALAAAHDSGVVHCDVKPSNVIVEDETGQVRLTDCRVGRLARGFRDGTARYSYAHYAAPEVIDGGPPVPATDVYALGMLLYEMLTGTTPYRVDDPAAVFDWHHGRGRLDLAGVSPALRPLLTECLRTEPTIRPTARQAVAELRRIVPALGGPPVAEPVAPAPLRTTVLRGTASSAGPARAGSYGPERPAGEAPSHRPAPTPGQAPGRPPSRPWHEPEHPHAPHRPSKNVRIGIAAGAAVLVLGAVLLVAIGMPASGGGSRNAAPGGQPGRGTPAGGAVTSGAGAPQLPAAAGAYTLEGATAFVHYWFDALTYAIGTGNTAGLEAASSPACRACAAVLQEIRTSYGSGGSMRGGVYSLREARADSFWNLDKPQLQIVLDRSPRSKLGPGGQLVETFPPGTFVSCQVLLERVGDRWRVLEVLAQTRIA
jgi:serine/threonine-protein kinase